MGHRYLRYKSFQRFTETYALLERAEQRGLFAARGGRSCSFYTATVRATVTSGLDWRRVRFSAATAATVV